MEYLLRLMSALIVLLICFPIHECAYAWVAEKMGDPTPRYDGRITLNPFVHLDIMGSILLVVSSLVGFGFGWAKSVRINSLNFKKYKLGMTVTALAGPASNLVMAYFFMIIYKILAYTTGMSEAVNTILFYIIVINIGLAVFNLLPIPPLDGWNIIMPHLPASIVFKAAQYRQIISMIFIVLICSRVLSYPLNLFSAAVFSAMNFLTGYVDLIFGMMG